MSLIKEGETDVRVIAVAGDDGSDAYNMAIRHVLMKKGSDVTNDYVIQGPNSACRLHCENGVWSAIASEGVTTDGAHVVEAPAPEAGLGEQLATLLGEAGELVTEAPKPEIIYNEPGR